MVSSLPRTALAVALTLILAPIAVAGTPPAPPPVTSSAHDAASWPLLIGIYQYQDTRIPRLRYAVSDVPATEQVPRGGAWWSVPSSLLSAFRSNMPPSHREQDLGFRCAQTPQRPGLAGKFRALRMQGKFGQKSVREVKAKLAALSRRRGDGSAKYANGEEMTRDLLSSG